MGWALQCDGIDDYISLGTLGNFGSQRRNSIIEITFKTPKNYAPGAVKTLYGQYNSMSVGSALRVDLCADKNIAYTVGKTHFYIRDEANASTISCEMSNAAIYDGNYHTLKIDYSDVTSSVLRVYIDGSLQSLSYRIEQKIGVCSNFIYPLIVGARNSAGNINGFSAVAVKDIKITLNSTIFAEYPIDEGTGTTINDTSGNSYRGTIYGASWVTVGEVKLASATAYGAATGTAKPIRGRGLRAAAHGMATVTARPYKIAFARATAQGAATAKAVILVLTIPKGVYNIGDEIFNRNQPISPDSLANYIEVWVNPLKPVAEAQEVYKTDEDDPFLIDANETKTVTIHYKKEPVTEVNIEFVNAPPYATIDSIKHYAWGANVTVTSPDAGTFELKATGKPLEVQGRELVVKKDETSILENGIKKYTFDNPFVQDRATAEMIAEKLLAFATPRADIEIDWRGDPALVLADPVLIPTFQRQGLDQREVFYVTKQELEYDGGLRAKLSGRKMGGNE